MRANNELLTLLRKVSIFSTITGKELGVILKDMTLTSYPKGAVLTEEGNPADCMYLIVSGSVRIVKKNPHAKNHTDEETTVAYLGRGDSLGEMSLLAEETFPYTTRIDSTANILILHKNDFEKVLHSEPSMAVAVSRVLSHHLSALNRQQKQNFTDHSRLFSVFSGLPYRDHALFSINLAISLVEQTRRKTLLLVVDNGSNLVAKGLGLESEYLDEGKITKGLFNDSGEIEKNAIRHPSGLEYICVSQNAFLNSIPKHGENLVGEIKRQYDYCLIILPPIITPYIQMVLNKSDKILFVSSADGTAEDLAILRQAEHDLQFPQNKEKIWLTTGSTGVPPDVPPGNRIPWDTSWASSFMSSGSPFIPPHAKSTQRKFDRLGRLLGQLLIGFAMGSGAAFGYSLIGMLRVMEREGIYPDVISGTSMGALIGAFYSCGINPDELEKIAKSITKKKLWSMTELSFPRSGLLTGRGILNFLRSHLGDKTFNDVEIPFASVAADIETGREIVITKGNVAQSVRASLSLPFFFQPYYLDGRYLVDGGLVNPVPTSIILSQGANILISANLTSKPGDRKVPRMGWKRKLPRALRGPAIPEVLIKTIYTMQYEIASARAEMAHVVLDINAKGLWWWDLDAAENIIRLGEASVEENLAKIKSQLPFFSDSCKVTLNRRGRKIY